MILDKIENLTRYAELIPGAAQIAAAFTAGSPSSAPCEVREKAYAAKPDDKRRFEVHYHTIDLMIAKTGAEIIHVCPMNELTLAEALPNGGDGHKLDGTPRGTAALLSAGYFCALFPEEAHMVGGKAEGIADDISKWVVKVSV